MSEHIDDEPVQNWPSGLDELEDDVPVTPTEPAPPIAENPEEPTLFIPQQKPVAFKHERNVDQPAVADTDPMLSFLRENPRTFQAILEKWRGLFDKIEKGQLSEVKEDREWMMSIYEAMGNVSLDDAPIGATERENSEWDQGVRVGETLIRGGTPKMRVDREKRLSKDEMVALLTRRSGMGSTYETFCPQSGLWLRLRSPSLAELLDMQTRMAQIKVSLGAETKGMAFSNAASVMITAITDLALACVIGSNAKFMSPTDLEHELSIFDEPILHHALAATLYPEGFNYSHPCVADVDNCNHVETAKLNMSALTFYDNLAFTQEQKKFMARRFTPASDADFKAYREGFEIGGKKVVWFDDVGVRLHIPNIAQRKASATQWLQSVIDISAGVFNEPPHGVNRSAYIDKLTQSSVAMQYAHMIDAIYLKQPGEDVQEDDQFLTDDSEVIVEYINNILSTPDYADRFFESITAYINASLVGIIAIPSFNCTKCDTPQSKVFHERFPHLICLDMLSTFFTLAGLKVSHLV